MIDFIGFRKAINRKYSAAVALEKVLLFYSHGQSTSKKKARGRSVGKIVYDGNERIIEAEKALKEREQELQAYKDQLENEKEKIKDQKLKHLIKLRYLDEISVPNIAIIERYSESTVYEAIRKAEKIINQERKDS